MGAVPGQGPDPVRPRRSFDARSFDEGPMKDSAAKCRAAGPPEPEPAEPRDPADPAEPPCAPARRGTARSGRTRDAIVDLAIGLFNARGTSAVTTNHIAAELGISPGNLYYHFRNKEEIVRAAYGRFGEECRALLETPVTGGAAEILRHYTAGTFDLMLRWRFFYEDTAELCRRDPDLAGDMADLQRRFVAHLAATLGRLRRTGIVSEGVVDLDLRLLADNIWLVSRGFWEFARNGAPEGFRPEEAIRDGVRHIFALTRPYLTPPARQALDRSLARDGG